jgi:hypothetical protein
MDDPSCSTQYSYFNIMEYQKKITFRFFFTILISMNTIFRFFEILNNNKIILSAKFTLSHLIFLVRRHKN